MTYDPVTANPLHGTPLKTRADARVKYGEIVAELHDITDEDTLALSLATNSEPLLQF